MNSADTQGSRGVLLADMRCNCGCDRMLGSVPHELGYQVGKPIVSDSKSTRFQRVYLLHDPAT